MTIEEIKEKVLGSREITEFQRRVYLELLKEEARQRSGPVRPSKLSDNDILFGASG